jgi:SAM-dependent methyltransferase
MNIKYKWLANRDKPIYWTDLTPLPTHPTFPFPFSLYYDLNDNKLRKFLKMQKGKILDLGCGDARFLAYADLGVDFSKGMLRRAKRKRKCLVLATILHLPFKDESFDVAFMVDTSIHIKPTKRKEAYNEAKRVSKSFYDFLAEDRTFIPFVMSIFRGTHLPSKLIGYLAYFALLFCFPIDRVRKLVISHGHFAGS